MLSFDFLLRLVICSRIFTLKDLNEDLQRQLSKTSKEQEIQKSSISKGISVVKDLLIEKSTIERKEARSKVMQNRLRLGQFVTQRVGASFQVIFRQFFSRNPN